MDTSLRNISLGGLSTFSPKTTRSTSRRNLTGLPSLNRTSSRYSVSGRSTQSIQVIYKTPYHVVESYGASLPVLVTEALAFADRSSTVSVRLSASGWAWFVCGRRLLIWQYRQEGQGRWAPGSQCRELTLPPSDLAHRAQLVAVYIPDKATVPACIAVSPEGAVRYWSSIAHEGFWIEENADLQGQECDSLSDITAVGCILATTTATICLVTPKISSGRHSITCHTLRSPQGWLGGIGRRVSSIIFGAMPAAQSLETRLVKVVPMVGGNQQGYCKLLVLAGHTLQKWLLNSKDPEQMIFEFDMDRLVRDNFLNSVWDSNSITAQDLNIWMLDMQPVDGGVLLLAAAANTSASATIYYAAVLVMTENDKPPDSFQMFSPLKFTDYYHGDETEPESLRYQFLLYGSTALVFNQKHLIATQVSLGDEEPDRIEFLNSGDCLLGGSLCNTTPIFFSRSHGLVSVTAADTSPLDFLNTSVSFSEMASIDRLSMSQFSETANLSLTGAHLEDLAVDDDDVSRLKAAFIYFNRRDAEACQEILIDLFPSEYERRTDIDTNLDVVVTGVSNDIVNDMPASDPRWAETHSIRAGISTTTSIQILQQLQGKQQTLELFVMFLKSVNLWKRLSAITHRRTITATAMAIQENAEKIVACIALRNLQNVQPELIDKMIRTVVYKRSLELSGGLTHLDLFFREVTKMHEVIQMLGTWSKDAANSNRRPLEICELLQAANSIILGILKDVNTFRKVRSDTFAPHQPAPCDLIEYLPWTAAPGSDGIQDTLMSQLDIGMKLSADQSISNSVASTLLGEDLLMLADILLDGYRSHLESLKGGEKHELLIHNFETQRHHIIRPFFNQGMLEAATKLAEKYLDFQTLVQICDVTNNPDRLDQYINKFAEHGFSEFLLNWYLKENEQDKLLHLFGNNTNRPMQHQQALMNFLQLHPSLAWLQALKAHQYSIATQTLFQLAKEETERLARKKTMLSIAKISMLASDEGSSSIGNAISHINHELNLIALQEELPQSILTYLNQDADNMSVLKPEQLIDLYISTENENANEFDFKKALEILNYIEDESVKEELKQRIWCQAILRDSWENLDLAYPLEVCRDLLFFKLIDLVVSTESTEYIVPLEMLLDSSDLESLATNQSFKYILQFIYEQLSSNMECSSQ